MRYLKIIFISVPVLSLILGCSFFPIQHNTTFYGLIIGINVYAGNPLEYCVADAESIYASLIQHGWKQEELELLLDGEATKVAILNTLTNFVNQAGENDYIFVYFSGHGSTIDDINGDESDGTDETIVPVDYVPFNTSTLITDDELGEIFSQCRTQKGVFIFDSCFSGGVINKSLSEEGYRLKFIKSINSKGAGTSGDLDIITFPVMTASAQDETAGEHDPLEHGIFTYYILEGLNSFKANKNNDNYITIRELFDYAEINTRFYTNLVQNPMLRFPLDFIDILITR